MQWNVLGLYLLERFASFTKVLLYTILEINSNLCSAAFIVLGQTTINNRCMLICHYWSVWLGNSYILGTVTSVRTYSPSYLECVISAFFSKGRVENTYVCMYVVIAPTFWWGMLFIYIASPPCITIHYTILTTFSIFHGGYVFSDMKVHEIPNLIIMKLMNKSAWSTLAEEVELPASFCCLESHPVKE